MYMDRMVIDGLEFHSHCGTTPEERKIGQRLKARVEIFGSLEKAAKMDSLKSAIDYVALCRCILQTGKKVRCRLLETLANRMAQEIFLNFSVQEVRIQLEKPFPPIDEILHSFSVEVVRKRRGIKKKGRNKSVR